MRVTHYHTAGPTFGTYKQHAVWGSGEGAACSPLVFLQRPKWIKDDAVWRKIVDAVSLNLPRGFEVK